MKRKSLVLIGLLLLSIVLVACGGPATGGEPAEAVVNQPAAVEAAPVNQPAAVEAAPVNQPAAGERTYQEFIDYCASAEAQNGIQEYIDAGVTPGITDPVTGEVTLLCTTAHWNYLQTPYVAPGGGGNGGGGNANEMGGGARN